MHQEQSAKGVVIIEAVIGISIFTVIALGFAQLFAEQLALLRIEGLRSEMQLGPIDPTLTFSINPTPAFLPLDSVAQNTLINNLGAHILGRDTSNSTFVIDFSYLQLDERTGYVTSTTAGTPLAFSNADGESSCLSQTTSLINELADYRTGLLSNFKIFGTNLPVGVKLFDVDVAGESLIAHIPYVGIISVLICTDAPAPLRTRDVKRTFFFPARRNL